MALTTNQINYLNAGLMIASCVLAFAFPFELFLFSYAVLGPLHYLTEISWLHERNYFTGGERRKKTQRAHKGWLILVGVTMVALIVGFVAAEGVGSPLNPKWEITLFYLVLVTASLVTVIKQRSARVILLVSALVLFGLLSISRYYVILAFFIVTIIHVLIFTGAFVFYGALKGRSRSGMLSLAVFLICTISFFVFTPAGHAAGNYIQQSYRSFNGLNAELIKLFRFGLGTTASEIYESRGGLVVMRLIAFAYTYHYLNWFSKTSIIKWHEVPRTRIVVMILIWIGALALYVWDYDTGMAVLYFLSILHVMLEFPLDHLTFVGIGRELYAWAGSTRRDFAAAD
ncbi:MAG TPA: hypothetical protein VFU37_19685 [Pyrinomonadaceae bacterium]|nr:hypothetical protein [Pyrinomonadaceae bacterium]